MATLGTLNTPYVQGALELVEPLALGDLISIYEPIDVDHISDPITNRFPIPPSAYGFLTDIDSMVDEPIAMEGADRIVTSALTPESLYLEPTLGQIWPR